MSDELITDPLLPAEAPSEQAVPQSGIGIAAFIILLMTASLIGILYLGEQLFHLPFTPSDLYDWPIRAGFAPWITFTTALTGAQATAGGNVAQSAPLVRWVVSLTLFLLVAFGFGLAFHLFILRRGRAPDPIDGLAIGALFGVPMIFISLAVAKSPLPAWMSAIWLGALFVLWGVALSYAFGRFMKTTSPTNAGGVPVEGGIGRRQFLLQFGAGATAITALSTVAGVALAPGKEAARLQRTLPTISPEFLEAQRELFGNFRRFALLRGDVEAVDGSNVVALGAEYPDRNYVSIWLGGQSPIVVYENLETVLSAFGTEGNQAFIYWLDN
jgi:hypothetical protein